jgi:hypothetical protein
MTDESLGKRAFVPESATEVTQTEFFRRSAA